MMGKNAVDAVRIWAAALINNPGCLDDVIIEMECRGHMGILSKNLYAHWIKLYGLSQKKHSLAWVSVHDKGRRRRHHLWDKDGAGDLGDHKVCRACGAQMETVVNAGPRGGKAFMFTEKGGASYNMPCNIIPPCKPPKGTPRSGARGPGTLTREQLTEVREKSRKENDE